MNLKRFAIALVSIGTIGVLAGCPELKPQIEPSILYAKTDVETITSGTDYQGMNQQGTVTIETQARLAEKVQVLAITDDGTETLPAVTCSDDTCVDPIQFTHQPTVETTYVVQALRGEGRCDTDEEVPSILLYPQECETMAAGTVSVVPPALLTLGDDPMNPSVTVNAGATVEVSYSVDAASWAIGILTDDGMGGMEFVPCVLESEFNDPEFMDPKVCWLPEAVDDMGMPTGAPEAQGVATFPDVQESLTVTGMATNGADDELDAIPAGAVTYTINVQTLPEVTSFTADDTTITSGSTVKLSWETTGDSVTITSDAMSPDEVTGLDQCTAGTGMCDVTVTADTSGGNVMITLSLVATNTDGNSAPATLVLTVGDAPTITAFEANPTAIASGGNTELTWTTDADASVINDGTSDIVESGTTTCKSGSACDPAMDTFTVMNITADTTFTLTASNDFGDSTATATVDVQGTPSIDSLTVDGDDATDGSSPVTTDTPTLAWTVTDGTTITIGVLPAASAPTTGDCTTVTTWNAGPSVTFANMGMTTLMGITADTCVEFKVTGPAGEDSQVFKIERRPNFESITVDGNDATSGGTFTVTSGNTADIQWRAAGADNSEVYTAPLGGATDCTDPTLTYTPAGPTGSASGSFTTATLLQSTCLFIRLTNGENGSMLDSPRILLEVQ